MATEINRKIFNHLSKHNKKDSFKPDIEILYRDKTLK